MTAVDQSRPRILLVSRAFVINDSQELLLIRRSQTDSNNAGLWEAPGGKLETGQDLSHGLEREIQEETGLIAQPTTYPLFADSFVLGNGKYAGLTYLVLFGVCKLIGGELKLSEEHSDSVWVSADKALDYELTPETHKALIILKAHLKN